MAKGRKLGRRCKYDPALLPQVYKLAYEEQTDKTIARQVFNVEPDVLCRWKSKFSRLSRCLARARRDWALDTYALAKRSFRTLIEGSAIIACGTNKDGSEWQKMSGPDWNAVKFALKNLGPEAEERQWVDTTRHELSGPSGGPMDIHTDIHYDARIVSPLADLPAQQQAEAK